MCYVIWQDKICQSTCPKISPFSRANITTFISDQWHFAAHVNLGTLNLPMLISVFHSLNHFSFNFTPTVLSFSEKLIPGQGIINEQNKSIAVKENNAALTGNRTRASRVASENSTTEPSVLLSTVIPRTN